MVAGGKGVKTSEKKHSRVFIALSFVFELSLTYFLGYGTFDTSDRRRKAAKLLLLTVAYSSIVALGEFLWQTPSNR
jgi:hypothetical protein